MRRFVVAGACVVAACASTGDGGAGEWKVVYSQDFGSAEGIREFAFSDENAWRWSQEDRSLELVGGSDYAPPHRSPENIALVDLLLVGDFDLEVEVMQTGKEAGHRDLCLFLGYQGPANYYYVHLASTPDDHANNIFVVDDAPRTRLAEVPESGVDWGTEVWHQLRIERRLAEGTIRVFFDDMETPVLEANDTRHGWGRLGFGSFDDSGRFRQMRIRAPAIRGTTGHPFVR